MEKGKKAVIKLTAKERLHDCSVPIIAITGGLGSGKSTLLKKIAEKGFKVINADLLIKNIYAHSPIVKSYLLDNHPSVYKNDQVDFDALRTLFYSNESIKTKLEEILYSELPIYFNNELKKINAKYVFYEIPLLFEKKLETKVDYIILAYSSRENQIKRTLKRDKTSKKVIESILSNQMDLEKKVSKSHLIINTETQNSIDQDISDALSKVADLFSV